MTKVIKIEDCVEFSDLRLTGIRIGESLHLGHYAGNIWPILCDTRAKRKVLIIADVMTRFSGRKDAVNWRKIDSLLLQLYALGVHEKGVLLCLESKFLEAINQFVSFCFSYAPVAKLMDVRPLKSALALDRGGMVLGQLIFPVYQAIECAALSCSGLYSNVDNISIIDYVNSVIKRLNMAGMGLPEVTLITGRVSYLRGIDGRKMSVDNRNAIYLNDSECIIRKKVKKIRTDRLRVNLPDSSAADHAVLYDILRVIDVGRYDFNQLELDYNERKITSMNIKDMVSESIMTLIAGASLNERHDRQSLALELRRRLMKDTDMVCELAMDYTGKVKICNLM